MLLPLILSFGTPLAHAGASSADIELFQPRFGDGPVAGVDSPWLRKRTVRVGLYGLYELNPLVEYRDDGSELPVIGSRIGGILGASYDFTDNIGLRASLPLSYDGGAETINGVDGFGMQDPMFGGRVAFVRTKPFQLGAHADLSLPFGLRQSWRGEANPRGHLGLLVGAKAGNFSVAGDLGAIVRTAIETEADFTLASELAVNLGAYYDIVPKRFGLGVGAWTRTGFRNFFNGGAENSAELVASARVLPVKQLQIELSGGRGLTEGYGTSDLRVILGLTYKQRIEEEAKPVEEEKPPPQTFLTEVSDDELEKAIEEEKRKTAEAEAAKKAAEERELELRGYAWKEDELARINGSRIVIRDPLKFAVNSNQVLPESKPTLAYVSRLIGANDMLVIEGHASEEGEFKNNYELSLARARAVWEELVAVGVSPAHLSYRGLGEVVPAKEGADEATLAESRRVVFYLVHLSEPPGGTDNRKLPWNGEAQPTAPELLPAATQQPATPAPETPAPKPEPAKEDEE